jgi:putative membrane protein
MKTLAATGIIVSALTFLVSCTSSERDSVKQAHEQNVNSAIDEDISEFLTEAADARLMDIEEGKLAQERGTTEAVRKYGERMVQEQTKLMHELRMLAAAKNITLPGSLSNKKADGLEDLKEKQGDDFDKKFIKMMTIDHKRDVREFEDATDFNDRDIQKFAARNLPLIESHLDEIKQIDEQNSRISEGEVDEN